MKCRQTACGGLKYEKQADSLYGGLKYEKLADSLWWIKI